MGKKRILIVDDDEEICSELSGILKDLGYIVTMAHDGLDGLSLIEKNSPDLLMLDLKLPNCSGMEVLKKVKKANRSFKVLVVTGRPINRFLRESAAAEDSNKIKEEENTLKLADGFISKPFNVEILVQKVEEMIGR